MRQSFWYVITTVIALNASLIENAWAQKPQTKPAAPQSKRPYVLGTKQLPGDFGTLGATYTVGSRNPLNVTLVRAEYSIARLVHDRVLDGRGLRGIVPPVDKKWLVLHYTVQNPNPTDFRLSWPVLTFTAVGADDQNYKVESAHLRDTASDTPYPTGKSVSMSLKPAQKINLMCALLVPAEGEVPKLIIGRGQDEAAGVVRYDLRGVVGKLPAGVAGADGFTPKDAFPATIGTTYPWRMFDVAVQSAAFTDAPLFGKPAKDGRFFTVSLKVTPVGKTSQLTGSAFNARLKTADGETLQPYNRIGSGILFFASRDEVYRLKPDVGDPQTVRMVFLVPGTASPATLSLTERSTADEFRPYVFEVK